MSKAECAQTISASFEKQIKKKKKLITKKDLFFMVW